MTQALYEHCTKQFIPVLFDANDEKHIPEPLRPQTFYLLDSDRRYQALYDALLGQAGIEPGPIGQIKNRPRPVDHPLTFSAATSPARTANLDATSRCGDEVPHQLANYLDVMCEHLDKPFPLLQGVTDAPMQQLYVKPCIRRSPPHPNQAPVDADDFLTLIRAGGVFSVSAPAGSGKTSLLNWLVHSFASQARTDLRAGKLPSQIPLLFRQSAWKPQRGLGSEPRLLGSPELLHGYPALESWLTEHRAVLYAFVDGMGELSVEDTSAEASQSDGAAFTMWKHGLAAVTVGHRGPCFFLGESSAFSLAPFDHQAREALLGKLIAARVIREPPEGALNSSLSAIPLYCTIACMRGEPARAVEDATRLLSYMAEHMITSRLAQKNMQCRLFLLYEEIAWVLLKQRHRGTVLGSQLEQLVCDEEFSVDVVLAPGLLRSENHNLSKAAFLHDSFMELFAAGKVLRMIKETDLNLYDVVKTLGAEGTSHLINRLEEDDDALERWTSLIFEDLTIQQYLYDSGTLHASSQALERMCNLSWLPLTSRLLLMKLKAHALYGLDAARRPVAIASLDELLEALERAAASLSPKQQQLIIWYRIWAADHRKNLVPGGEGEVEALLPAALRSGTEPERGDEYLILRAAHYWGHRGNQESRRMVKGEPLKGDPLVFYKRAAAYRAYTVPYSFGLSRDRDIRLPASSALDEASKALRRLGLPTWAVDFTEKERVTGTLMECFPSMHQALGDIAHQLVCSGIVYCWGAVSKGDAMALPMARTYYETARHLWRLATEVGRRRERIRYVLRLAELCTIIAMLERPTGSEQEAAGSLAASLSAVREDFEAEALVDVRAMEGMSEAVQEFHRALIRRSQG